MVEVKVWAPVGSYSDGMEPYVTFNCKACFLSAVIGFVRNSFEKDFVCLIKYIN